MLQGGLTGESPALDPLPLGGWQFQGEEGTVSPGSLTWKRLGSILRLYQIARFLHGANIHWRNNERLPIIPYRRWKRPGLKGRGCFDRAMGSDPALIQPLSTIKRCCSRSTCVSPGSLTWKRLGSLLRLYQIARFLHGANIHWRNNERLPIVPYRRWKRPGLKGRGCCDRAMGSDPALIQPLSTIKRCCSTSTCTAYWHCAPVCSPGL
ncbi:UNVERIFIED_CONTAM: hypothetical protein FKN15_017921 [Acipenser sinensis]